MFNNNNKNNKDVGKIQIIISKLEYIAYMIVNTFG